MIECSWRRWKKWSTHITMACFFLAGGIEYSVIFPTMWDYLQGMGGQEWLYGLSLAAFSISNLFTGPVFGFVFDRTHRTKLIVLFANLFEIGGNFMYFTARSKYMILGSRFIVGVGAGAGAAIFGDLARSSTVKERTRVFSVFMALRMLGLVIGPAFNLVLRMCDFKVGPFRVYKYTAPGAFMMIIWIILELMFLLFFYELPPVKEDKEESESQTKEPSPVHQSSSRPNSPHPVTVENHEGDAEILMEGEAHSISNSYITKSTKDMFKHSHSLGSSQQNSHDERAPLLPNGVTRTHSLNRTTNSSAVPPVSYGTGGGGEEEEEEAAVTVDVSCWEKVVRMQRHVKWLISEFLREEIVLLLSVIFITRFNQTAVETMVVPMAETLLKWTEQQTSIFYSVAGAEIILSFIVVSVLSKKVGDRWQILIGLSLELSAYTWMIGTIGNATTETPWVLWRFIIGGVLALFGLPFFVVTGASLYSKFLPMHIQGFGQGVRRSIFSIAAILGPLWAGGAVAFDTYYVLFGVLLGLLVLIMVLTLLSFNRLKEPAKIR